MKFKARSTHVLEQEPFIPEKPHKATSGRKITKTTLLQTRRGNEDDFEFFFFKTFIVTSH